MSDTNRKPDVDGPCPFCFRPIRVWWKNPPRDPGEIHHTLPLCERFKTLSADEYVAAVAQLAGS